MKLWVYTWFPYQSSDRFNEANDITLLDIWVIFVRVHFIKKINSFSANFSKSFNGCPMNSVVRDGQKFLLRNMFTSKIPMGVLGGK